MTRTTSSYLLELSYQSVAKNETEELKSNDLLAMANFCIALMYVTYQLAINIFFTVSIFCVSCWEKIFCESCSVPKIDKNYTPLAMLRLNT